MSDKHKELRERLSKLPKYDRGINWQLRNWQGSEELTVYGTTANFFKWILDNTEELIASLQSSGLVLAGEAVAWANMHEDGRMVGLAEEKPDNWLNAAPLYAAPQPAVAVGDREKYVGQGMAIAAAILVRVWGDDTQAKEIMGAAGYRSVADLERDDVDKYDIDVLATLFRDDALSPSPVDNEKEG